MKALAGLLLASIAGLIAWFGVGTAIDLAMRGAWPAYVDAVPALSFTPVMLVARLLLGVACSVVGGWVATRLAGPGRRAWLVLAALLLVLFIPEHARLWERFPAWYHAIFLTSLLVVPALGARGVRAAGTARTRNDPLLSRTKVRR